MVCGIIDVTKGLFNEINLDNKDIYMSLFNNISLNIKNIWPKEALTGPIIKNDIETVKRHINNLNGNELKELLEEI